jgi:OOP family OmpA-OmpF porin
MSKKMFVCLLLVIAAGWVSGCASPPATSSTPAFTPQTFPTAQYTPKVDNYLVLLDRSQTMQASHNGQAKLDIAKEVVRRMSLTLPNFDFTGGLRTFAKGSCCGDNQTDLIYGMGAHNAMAINKSLMSVNSAGGNTPLTTAINAANADLAQASGPIALIVVSDGEDQDDSPVKAAQALKQAFGDRLCITTVQVGDDPAGASVLNRIAAAGQCGLSFNADAIMSPAGMGDFVEKVFLAKMAPKAAPKIDSDGDGVYDEVDECPNTPKGAPVDKVGCPLDSDMDGVPDYRDQCPNTPRGARVDSRGCWVLAGVKFDTGKWDIKTQYYPILNEVVAILQKNKNIQVVVEGHTDNVGSAKFNQGLSEKRAASVMKFLISSGISGSRLSSRGYGFSRPAASNDTAEGRRLNRRVELRPIK